MAPEIRRLVANIVRERERLLRIAETLAERFRATERELAKTPEQNRGYYGIRIRRNAAGVSIQWYKRRFPKTATGRTWVRHDYLRMSRGLSYSEHAFVGMREAERITALEIEQETAHLRARSGQLATMLKMAKAYQREAQRYNDTYPATIAESNFDEIDENIERMIDDVMEGTVRAEYD